MFKTKYPLFNALFWVVTGCPMYLSIITIAAVVAAGAAVAGAAGSAVAAKKGAKAQANAASQAGKIDQTAVDKANLLAEQQYNEDIARQTNQLTTSQARLDPYASAGYSALNTLSSLTNAPHGAISASAASGTDDATRAKVTQWKNDANSAWADNQKFKEQAVQSGDWETVKRLDAQAAVLQSNSQAADKRYAGMTAYVPAQSAQDASPSGGELYRGFNNGDYKADPTSGGHDAPDLTQNFDEAGWFNSQGKKVSDLTANFDRTGYLKNAGFTEADLARKFTANDFKVDPGYQFRIEQGNQGIENSAAAQGGQLSGATIKALAKYNSDLGSQEYGNSFDRYQKTQQQAGNALTGATNSFNYNRENLSNQFGNAFDRFGLNRNNASNVYNSAYDRWTGDRTNTFNRLASLADKGQVASTTQGNWGMDYAGNASRSSQNYSNTVGNNTTSSGQRQGEYVQQATNATTSGNIAASNAVNQGIGQASNSLTNYAYLRNANNYNNNNNQQYMGYGPTYRRNT